MALNLLYLHTPLYQDRLSGNKVGKTYHWVLLGNGFCHRRLEGQVHTNAVYGHMIAQKAGRDGPQQSCCRDPGRQGLGKEQKQMPGQGPHGKNVLLESGQKRSQRSREAAGGQKL